MLASPGPTQLRLVAVEQLLIALKIFVILSNSVLILFAEMYNIDCYLTLLSTTAPIGVINLNISFSSVKTINKFQFAF